MRYLDDLTPPTIWAATTAVASWIWDQPLLGWFGTFVSLGWLYLGLKKLQFEKYKFDLTHAKK